MPSPQSGPRHHFAPEPMGRIATPAGQENRQPYLRESGIKSCRAMKRAGFTGPPVVPAETACDECSGSSLPISTPLDAIPMRWKRPSPRGTVTSHRAGFCILLFQKKLSCPDRAFAPKAMDDAVSASSFWRGFPPKGSGRSFRPTASTTRRCPEDRVIPVDSFDSPRTIALLRHFVPGVVVNGTRIVAHEIPGTIDAPFIDTPISVTGAGTGSWGDCDRRQRKLRRAPPAEIGIGRPAYTPLLDRRARDTIRLRRQKAADTVTAPPSFSSLPR